MIDFLPIQNGFAMILAHSGQQGEDEVAILLASVVAITALVIYALKNRARVQVKRLETIQELSRSGQLSREDIKELLGPKTRFLLKGVFIAAWFGLFAGLGMLIAAWAEGWPDRSSEFLPPSLSLIGLALATISAPIMLKELKKQGIL